MNISWIKLSVMVLCLLSAILCPAQERAYHERYDAECQLALSFWVSHEAEFKAIGSKAGVSARFLFALVAPEISQFGYLSDRAQTYILKVMYVQRGKAYADFSIGRFQMKPSFIERLEQCLRTESTLCTLFPEVLFTAESEWAERAERIKRLESMEWQLVYLALFCRVVQQRFEHIVFADETEKLQFYANAYNVGFYLNASRLQQTQGAYFPHLSRQKYRYADISLWFYQNIQLD
jgi:hypothetical protein